LGCGREGGWLCARCLREKIVVVEVNVCPGCGSRDNGFWMCGDCCTLWQLDGLLVCWQKSELVKRLVHYLKYLVVHNLAGLMARVYADRLMKEKFDVVVPVPIGTKRYRKRGFNQSELIASRLAKLLNLEYDDGLVRIKETRSQVGLSRNDRLKNVTGVFMAKKTLTNLRVLLVDDVCTTMATLNECSRALKKAGAKEVVGIVLARGL